MDMSMYIRPRRPGAIIFFTVNLTTPGDDLLVREIDRLRLAFQETFKDRPCRQDAIVVLPDHLHAVWTLPAGDSDYSGRWGKIKSLFVRGLPERNLRSSHRRRGEKGIWQRRFWEHHVRSRAELRALLEYCWFNPVKHGLTARAVDWPFSSIHREIRRGMEPPEQQRFEFDGEFGEFSSRRVRYTAPYA